MSLIIILLCLITCITNTADNSNENNNNKRKLDATDLQIQKAVKYTQIIRFNFKNDEELNVVDNLAQYLRAREKSVINDISATFDHPNELTIDVPFECNSKIILPAILKALPNGTEQQVIKSLLNNAKFSYAEKCHAMQNAERFFHFIGTFDYLTSYINEDAILPYLIEQNDLNTPQSDFDYLYALELKKLEKEQKDKKIVYLPAVKDKLLIRALNVTLNKILQQVQLHNAKDIEKKLYINLMTTQNVHIIAAIFGLPQFRSHETVSLLFQECIINNLCNLYQFDGFMKYHKALEFPFITENLMLETYKGTKCFQEFYASYSLSTMQNTHHARQFQEFITTPETINRAFYSNISSTDRTDDPQIIAEKLLTQK